MNKPQFVRLTCVSNDSRFTLRCDSIAWIRTRENRHPCILTLSAAGPVTAVKAVRALFTQSSIKAGFYVQGVERYRTELCRNGAYKSSIAVLEHGIAHLVVRTMMPGLLSDNSDDALWAELNSDRFTTPLLWGWMPYIRKQLISKKLLVASSGFCNEVMMLKADTANIDEIVSQGILRGEFSFTQE